MHEKENILDILKKTRQALKDEDSGIMKDLSDRTVHTASLYQDPDNITIAVLVYSLSKIIERKKYRSYPGWSSFIKNYMLCINKSIAALEENNEVKFRKEVTHIRKHINSLSGNLKYQIQEVFRKAEINKASRIYEHGISMQKTADLLGISIWELADYAGTTGIPDISLSITLPERQRIKQAFEIFEE